MSDLARHFAAALALVLIGAAIVLFLFDTSTVTSRHRASPPGRWRNVVDDRFSRKVVPRHWQLYHAPYANAPNNCASPSHDYVAGGYLHIVEKYERSTPAGVSCPYAAGWYTGGLKLDPVHRYIGNDQRVTLRYRIVSRNGVVSHHIIPMRWPTHHKSAHDAHRGEEDFLKTDTLVGGHFLLYEGARSGGTIRSSLYPIDMTRWHTVRLVQLSHTIYAYIDDMSKSVWTYHGDSTTIPDVLRTTVLQQECSYSNGCPTGKTGSEDIEIDWITVDTAAKKGGGRRKGAHLSEAWPDKPRVGCESDPPTTPQPDRVRSTRNRHFHLRDTGRRRARRPCPSSA